MSGGDLRAARLKVFQAVFSTNQPTQPTPDLGFPSPGHAFGIPVKEPFTHDRSQAPISRARTINRTPKESHQVIWDRSWHVVTDYFVALHDQLSQALTSSGLKGSREQFDVGNLPVPSIQFSECLKKSGWSRDTTSPSS